MAVKKPILLWQLVDYFRDDGMDIQVTFEDQEWDEFDQVSISSKMLLPYMGWEIVCMGFENAIDNERDILRVTLKEKT